MENYCVIIEKEEIEIIILYLGYGEIEGITKIWDDYEIRDDILIRMKEKGFFVEKSGEIELNSFVRFVFWSAVNAQASLIRTDKEGDCSNFYFHEDTIIYVDKRKADKNYVFYWMPFITSALGGFAVHFDFICKSEVSDKKQYELKIEGKIEESKVVENIIKILYGNKVDTVKNREYVIFKSKLLEQKISRLILLQADNEYVYIHYTGNYAIYEKTDYYSFVRNIFMWVLEAHGKCIQTQEDYNGRV